jgi:hypothetical protein
MQRALAKHRKLKRPWMVQWNGSARYFDNREAAERFYRQQAERTEYGCCAFARLWFQATLVRKADWVKRDA